MILTEEEVKAQEDEKRERIAALRRKFKEQHKKILMSLDSKNKEEEKKVLLTPLSHSPTLFYSSIFPFSISSTSITLLFLNIFRQKKKF